MQSPLATEENLARLHEIAGELGLADVTVARLEAALKILDAAEASYGGPLDELAFRRLVIRPLDAGRRPGAA